MLLVFFFFLVLLPICFVCFFPSIFVDELQFARLSFNFAVKLVVVSVLVCMISNRCSETINQKTNYESPGDNSHKLKPLLITVMQCDDFVFSIQPNCFELFRVSIERCIVNIFPLLSSTHLYLVVVVISMLCCFFLRLSTFSDNLCTLPTNAFIHTFDRFSLIPPVPPICIRLLL